MTETSAPSSEQPTPALTLEEQLTAAIRQRDAAILGLREAVAFVGRLAMASTESHLLSDLASRHASLLRDHLEAAGVLLPTPPALHESGASDDQADGADS